MFDLIHDLRHMSACLIAVFFSSSSDCETCDISSDSQAIQSERGAMASGSKFTWSTFSKEDPIIYVFFWADEIGRTSLEKVWLALELEAKIAND